MNLVADLVSTLSAIYLLAILLRFLFQVVKADFYNPVSQAVVQVTDPLVRIFRTVIPGYRGIDMSCLVLALVFEVFMYWVLSFLYGVPFANIGAIILRCIGGVIIFTLYIYYASLFIAIVMSFIMMLSGNMNPHPVLNLAWQLVDPILRPFRPYLNLGGLDFSPILIFFLINRLLMPLVSETFDVARYAPLIVGA